MGMGMGMGMGMEYNSLAVSCIVGLLIYWAYRVLNVVWFKPKKIEKCLRDQGFSGNPYKIFMEDQKESSKMIQEAWSKPIGVDDDIKPRVLPHVIQAIKNHGKNSFMWVGRVPRLHITEPELIKDVLTKHFTFQKNHHGFDPITKLLLVGIGSLEGEKWVKHRGTINPIFRYEKLKLMNPAFYSCCHEMVTNWENIVSAKGSAEFDVWPHIEGLTRDLISQTLFGSGYKEGRRLFALTKELAKLTDEVIHSVYIPGRSYLPTRRNKRMKAIDKELKGRITALVYKKTKEMKTDENAGSDDLLGILLESNLKAIQEQGNNKNAGMSVEDIVDELKLFHFAGQDTTSGCLFWTLFLLSKFPYWQERTREEVFQVFGNNKPDYDGIHRLKLMHMVLHEVLRLYPPIIELTKVAEEDTKLGKYFLPAGTQVMLPTLLLHYDREIWGDDVNEFNPERFSKGVLKAIDSQVGSFLPFSLGPRMCIGQNFALLEVKMAMVLILQRFSFELSPSYEHAPYTLITMQPQYGARMILHKL